MRQKVRRKMYKLLSDVGLSSLSIGTFGMISSMLTSNDPTLMFLSTGFFTGGIVCKIGSEILLIKGELNEIDNEESIWNNSKIYYLEIEKNKLKRVETHLLYKKGGYSFKQKETLLKDLYIEKLLLNKKEEILNNNKISVNDKLDILSELESNYEFSSLYIDLKEKLLDEAKVIGFPNERIINKDNSEKKIAKISKFPKNKDK